MISGMVDASHHALVKSVAGSLRQRCGVREGDHVLVAVSGGADSVALLRALATLAPRHGWRLTLTVAHVDHGWRHDSAGDAAFVRELAQTLNLTYVSETLDLPDRNEAAAREARYAAMDRMAGECGATLVATAHHGDDQLETILMRLLRGTAIGGLGGIAWRRENIIRPMLGVDRAAVIDYLNTLGQSWRDDPTNRDVSLTRNKLRHEVLPVLRQVQPEVCRKVGELSDHLRDLSAWVEQETDRHTPEGDSLDRGQARQLPAPLLASVLRRMIERAGVGADSINHSTLGALAEAVNDHTGGSRRFDLAGGVVVFVERDAVRIER